MALQSKRVRRFVLKVLPVALALAVLFASLILVSNVPSDNVTSDVSDLGQPYAWVLGLTIFALLVVLVAIFHRVFSLTKNVREHAPGAMLSARWVRAFFGFVFTTCTDRLFLLSLFSDPDRRQLV